MKTKMNNVFLYSILLSLFFSLSWTQSAAIPSNTQLPALSGNMCNAYLMLQKALFMYKEIAVHGGWSSVSKGASLKKGDLSARVAELKKRLLITGDLISEGTKDENTFDEELHDSVIRFQRRHGLNEDGAVGPETIKNLNIPVEKRIHQIELNMERLKLTPKDMGQRYIAVNIAAFELEVVENENSVINMKVIVGKPYLHSPLFSAKMTHLVFNPSWYVPNSIAIKEILPKVKKESDYLVKEGIKVFEKEKGYREALNASAINWADVNADNFKYRFVQVPGILNPLGKIKFVFPNKYNVYLHDTPAKVLFERSSRAFSHGCIRIEKPVELAEYLLRDDSAWTHEKILAMIDMGKEVKIKIPSPVNVHVLYLTAWVDKDNILQFREDVYGRDKRAE
jgi:murein L,D-transpeptidase YcbB/YkuD